MHGVGEVQKMLQGSNVRRITKRCHRVLSFVFLPETLEQRKIGQLFLDMLLVGALPTPKIPCRKRQCIYELDHLA